MSRRFRLAGSDDDAALRAILREVPMPGSMALSFRREPSYFIGAQAGNTDQQTIVYADDDAGTIAGLGERSIRRLYLNGEMTGIGYLNSLRGLPEARSGLNLARGYRFLRSLHADGRVPFYLSTILDDNKYAKVVLEGERGNLPAYIPVARLVTYLVSLRRPYVTKPSRVIGRVTPDGLQLAHTCLQAWNRKHQFAPDYSPDDLLGETPVLPGFSLRNLYAYTDHDMVSGTLGVWDQSSFKQVVVDSYAPLLERFRGAYNTLAWWRGIPALPDPGQPVKSLYAALISARENNLDVFDALLRQAVSDWSGKGYDYLILGLCEGHPFQRVARDWACRSMMSTVYRVFWRGDALPRLDGRQPHLEVATL